MDPETQKLIEKTRQRREMLHQRMAGTPDPAPRKRRTPVLEQEPENILTEKQINQDGDLSAPTYDSPKRQCLREGGQDRKPDTPAIRGVQSRIKDLPSALTGGDEENLEITPTPKPRKSVSSPPIERKALTSVTKSPAKNIAGLTGTSSSRKGRFAALASNINSWEDDLTHHVIQKEEEKKPKWQPPAKADNSTAQVLSASSGKGPAPTPPNISNVTSKSVPVNSPKKTHDATAHSSVVSASPSSSLTRNSPLRSSKVELNRSPKPFSTNYVINKSSPSSKSANELTRVSSPRKQATPVKAVPDTLMSSSGLTSDKAETTYTTPTATTTKTSGLVSHSEDVDESTPLDDKLNTTIDEPTLRPVSQRFASWAKKVDATKPPAAEPSKQPLSTKLASFEKKITENTPNASHARTPFASKTPKKVCLPTMSASTPAPSSHTKECDPTELSVSQRMSQMQEKLSNTPQMCRKQDEPTAYSVGARMSAWENMTASNLVSDIKKVNPVEGTPVNKLRPASEFTPKSTIQTPGPPANPPSHTGNKSLTAKKSFKECIEEKASEVLARREVITSMKTATMSPVKMAAMSPAKTDPGSSNKIIHSPSKVSAGTKSVQQLLVERVQDSNTTCSSMAAQSRAARLAELQQVQNRWKNGVLKDDDSSSDECVRQTDQTCKDKTPQKQDMEAGSSKREESRNRVRAEFNQKLAEIGLGNNGSVPQPPPPPPPPALQGVATAVTAAPVRAGGGQTSSIYNLIKKREDIASESTQIRKVKFDDSFDDTDDDSQLKIPKSAARLQAQLSVEDNQFKIPQVPRFKEESESEIASSSDVGDEEFGPSQKMMMDFDDDDISLKGFASEAVRRESILPPPPSQPQSYSQSSLDSYDDDHIAMDSEGSVASSSKLGGYQPDDESANECDDRHAVGDLLDEAFDSASDDSESDMNSRDVGVRQKPQAPDYDPDMDINNVVMRKKGPVPAQRSNLVAADSSEDDADSRPYSLESYRKSANVHQHHMEPVVRKSRYVGAYVEEEDVVVHTSQQPARDEKRAVLERIRELQELVQQEQSVIMQTSNALNKCCVGNSYFAGSQEQVECNRVLLIACQKRQCYMTEIERLKETGVLSHDGPGPQGSVTISDIRLPLKKEFVTKIGTSQDTTTHYFILLIRNGAQLICTQMLSTHDPMMRGSLDFPNLIKINGITANFKLTLDIYTMSVSREFSSKEKKKKTPKKGKGYAFALESPGGPTAVRTTCFSQVTSVQLTMKCLDKNSFHLDRLPHLSPLYGQIFLRLKCLMEVNVEERGFLTMFEDVSGFGAWHRRWCVLAGNKICVWKYPDDESRKDPMTIIDLKRCVTEKVGLVPRDICARPNTFEMMTVRQPLKGEHDTLITRTYNSTTSVRHQMSADSKEERIVWCNKINRTLANLRTWNADALKPSKPVSTPSSSYR